MRSPFAAGVRQDPWAARFLGEVKIAQAATVEVPMSTFGANALVLGPSSWGFGAPTAIAVPVEWPKEVRPGW